MMFLMVGGEPKPVERTLAMSRGPDAVSEVRHFVRDVVDELPGLTEIGVDAELVVSELVTNAVLHAAPPVTVRVLRVARGLRVEVADGSRTPLIRLVPTDDAMTGRGLAIVQAVSRSWGVQPTAQGKVVWCELRIGEVPTPDLDDLDLDLDDNADVDALLADWDDLEDDILGDSDDFGDADDPAEPDPRFTVHIGDVSTDLLRAAKGHVDNLVREVTLARTTTGGAAQSDDARDVTELMHAVVERFGEARTALKRAVAQSVARGDRRTDLVLSLPLSSAEAGEAYLEALDDVDRYARAARLLTLETPPQHRVFRRWYVETLVQQLRAAAGLAVAREPETLEERLLDELDELAAAQRESARGARLQQVTSSLARAATLEEVVTAVVEEGLADLGASGGTVLVPDGAGHLRAPAVLGFPEQIAPRLRSESADDALPGAAAMRTGEAVWVEQAQERDERFPVLREIEPGTVALCAVPLVLGERTVGVLRFSFDRPRLFDADERRFVLALAGQTAQALDRAQALARLEQATNRLTFLSEASAELARDLDPRQTLTSIARLVVPRLADWCVIHLLEEGTLRPVAVAHTDPEKVAWAEQLQAQYPVDLSAPAGVPNVLRTGRSELYPEITDEMLAAGSVDSEQLQLMRDLALSSALIVPLQGRGQAFGGLTMIYAESGRRYGPSDLALAEDLAHRAAIAVENAMLYEEQRRLAAMQSGVPTPEVPGTEASATPPPDAS